MKAKKYEKFLAYRRPIKCLKQGCKNPCRQIVVAIKFCNLAPNVYKSSVWKLLHITLLALMILRWLLDIQKIFYLWFKSFCKFVIKSYAQVSWQTLICRISREFFTSVSECNCHFGERELKTAQARVGALFVTATNAIRKGRNRKSEAGITLVPRLQHLLSW